MTDRDIKPHPSASSLWKAFAVFALGYLLLQAGLYPLLRLGHDQVRQGALGKFNQARFGELDSHLVILGSSRALVHYSPTVMREVLGSKTPIANLGINAADLVEQEGLYHLLVASSQPRMVALNLGTAELDPEVMHFHYRNLTPQFFYLPEVRRILIDQDIYSYKYWLSPVSTLMADRAVAALFGRGLAYDPNGGAALADLGWDGLYDSWLQENPNGKIYETQPDRWAALERIAQDTQREGAPPMVWIVAPELAEWQAHHKNRAEILEKLQRLAEAHDIPFYDFANEDCELCKDKRWFYNSQHLNRAGAEIFSENVAETLLPLIDKAI